MSYRAGYVGLIGLPNAGKSTLLNAVVGEKVAIVTPKPQTTRQRVVGLLTMDEGQLCFNDAPGLIRAEKGLNRFLAQEFTDVIADSDVLAAVLNIDEPKLDKLLEVVEVVRQSKKPCLVVITKCDLPQAQHRLEILRGQLANFAVPVVSGSASKNPKEFGAEVAKALLPLLPENPGPLYPPDLFTPHSTRDLVAEIIREQCFLQLHEEVPFGLAVRIRRFIEDEGPTVKIEADIVVTKEGHKPMVIGAKGSRLKEIGTGARQEIEKLLGRKAFVGLHVAARPRWADQPHFMKEFGYGLHPA